MYFTREGYVAAPLATTPPRGGQLNFLAHAYYDVTVLQKHSSVYFQTHPPIPLNVFFIYKFGHLSSRSLGCSKNGK